MFSALLNIVIPVFGVVGLGALYGRLRPGAALGYVNRANIELFTPALVFSALVKYPLALAEHLPLIAAGALVILLPGLLLALLKLKGIERAALILPAMFRNTGNLGIPLMLLAFGEQQLGAIVILFVLSNLLHFSVGMFILSANTSRWLWLRSPVLWAALAGLLVANLHITLPEYVVTTASLLGQISVPLMLFALGIRLMEGELDHLGLALKCNLLFLLAGGIVAAAGDLAVAAQDGVDPAVDVVGFLAPCCVELHALRAVSLPAGQGGQYRARRQCPLCAGDPAGGLAGTSSAWLS